MSRTLMGQRDIPSYIREMLPRLKPTTTYETADCLPGYTYRLYGKHKIGYEAQLLNELERFTKWARRYCADCYIARSHMWYDDVTAPAYAFEKGREHRRKAYRERHHNYITIVVTDPVAKQLEIAKREQKEIKK